MGHVVEIECAIRVRAREEWARVPRGRGLVVVDLELRLHDPGLRFTPPSSAMAPF
jgi:hypothetical protein